jgi:hypothetical protein
MNHYLVCRNPECGFVFDIRINGRANGNGSLLLESCPHCGSEWISSRPVSGQALGLDRLRKLPPCSCCKVHLRRK